MPEPLRKPRGAFSMATVRVLAWVAWSAGPRELRADFCPETAQEERKVGGAGCEPRQVAVLPAKFAPTWRQDKRCFWCWPAGSRRGHHRGQGDSKGWVGLQGRGEQPAEEGSAHPQSPSWGTPRSALRIASALNMSLTQSQPSYGRWRNNTSRCALSLSLSQLQRCGEAEKKEESEGKVGRQPTVVWPEKGRFDIHQNPGFSFFPGLGIPVSGCACD